MITPRRMAFRWTRLSVSSVVSWFKVFLGAILIPVFPVLIFLPGSSIWIWIINMILSYGNEFYQSNSDFIFIYYPIA